MARHTDDMATAIQEASGELKQVRFEVQAERMRAEELALSVAERQAELDEARCELDAARAAERTRAVRIADERAAGMQKKLEAARSVTKTELEAARAVAAERDTELAALRASQQEQQDRLSALLADQESSASASADRLERSETAAAELTAELPAELAAQAGKMEEATELIAGPVETRAKTAAARSELERRREQGLVDRQETERRAEQADIQLRTLTVGKISAKRPWTAAGGRGRAFGVGAEVRPRCYGGPPKWVRGRVATRTGPVSYEVDVGRGGLWSRPAPVGSR